MSLLESKVLNMRMSSEKKNLKYRSHATLEQKKLRAALDSTFTVALINHILSVRDTMRIGNRQFVVYYGSVH